MDVHILVSEYDINETILVPTRKHCVRAGSALHRFVA